MSREMTYPRGAVLADSLVTKRSLVTDMGLVFAGVFAVALLAQVSIPLWPVPVTGQTLGVIVVGAALGARRAMASMATYMVAGVAGLPVFAGFSGGPLTVLQPSFGYIIGFIFAAGAVGWIAERTWDRQFWKSLPLYLAASAIPFVFGVPYLGVVLGAMGQPNDVATLMALGFTPFILGGVIKAVIAAGLTPLAWRAVHAVDARKQDN
mgnify:FL=1